MKTKLSQNENLSDLKMTDYITNVKNIEKDIISQETN